MFSYGKILLIVLCSIIFSTSAVASDAITPDTRAKLRIQSLILHGEIAVFDTTVGNFEKILIKRIIPKYPNATSFLVVLENESHASAFKDTIEFLNYRTRFKSQKGFIFSLEPIEPIMPRLLPELLDQGFTKKSKMFIMSMRYHNNSNKGQK